VCGLKEDFNAVLKQAQSKMAELPNTDSPFVSEMEFIVVMRHFLDCKEEIIQEQLSGIDGDEVEAEPLPPNGMSSVWVLPEVFDLDIEVKPRMFSSTWIRRTRLGTGICRATSPTSS